MIKTISASDLRTQLKDVLNQVVYGDVDYLVEKFGEPTVAMISMKDYELLQEIRREHSTSALRDLIKQIRSRHSDLDAQELASLIEEARADFHRSPTPARDAT